MVAVKKFPQRNVLGTSMRTTLSSVMELIANTPYLPMFHLANISNTSGLPETPAQPCFMPMYAAKSMSAELIIFIAILIVLNLICASAVRTLRYRRSIGFLHLHNSPTDKNLTPV